MSHWIVCNSLITLINQGAFIWKITYLHGNSYITGFLNQHAKQLYAGKMLEKLLVICLWETNLKFNTDGYEAVHCNSYYVTHHWLAVIIRGTCVEYNL